MKTVSSELLECCVCKNPIQPNKGLVIHGNLYVAAQGKAGGGLIGNNFPIHMDDSVNRTTDKHKFTFNEVAVQAFCLKCFFDVTVGIVDTGSTYAYFEQSFTLMLRKKRLERFLEA